MGEATSPRRFSSPSGGGRIDACDRGARGLARKTGIILARMSDADLP